MKIYIAGKVSGLDRQGVLQKFEKASEELKKEGHHPFVPCVLPDYDDVPHQDYLHICYAMIDICDAVYMLSDWQQSTGARMELQYAADWKKKLLYQDSNTIEPDYPIIYRHPDSKKE